MSMLAAMIAGIFALGFLTFPWLGGGWFWDLGNGLGFLAYGGLLFQAIPGRRGRMLRRHETLGYAVLGLVLAHGFWLLTGDAAVRFYLLPGAPIHMWLGLTGVILLSVLTVLARLPDRRNLHRDHGSFRRWHRGLGLAVVLAAAGHVLLSGFYLPHWWQVAGLLLLSLGAGLGRGAWARLGPPPAATVRGYLGLGLLAVAAFVTLRGLGS